MDILNVKTPNKKKKKNLSNIFFLNQIFELAQK